MSEESDPLWFAQLVVSLDAEGDLTPEGKAKLPLAKAYIALAAELRTLRAAALTAEERADLLAMLDSVAYHAPRMRPWLAERYPLAFAVIERIVSPDPTKETP